MRLLPDGGDIFYTEYHNETPTEAIARGLSTIEDRSITEIPPIYDYVNSDSMNRMMENAQESNQDVTVHVTIEEYEVSINSDGIISISDLK